jgi:1-phosphofructokinase
VFSPGPRLTVTIETGSRDHDEPHLHVGGQGPWAARMAAILGADVAICVPLGGESGMVVGHLLNDMPVEVHRVDVRGDTAMYLHDRRGGERHELAATIEPALDRHEFDDLYNVMLGTALVRGTALLTGTLDPEVVSPEDYGRLAEDLRNNGVPVAVDLSGEPLRQAVRAGVDVVKVSHTELAECGYAPGTSLADVHAGIDRMLEDGATNLIVTRAADPAVACVEGRRYEVASPSLQTVDHRGAGDSMTGAVAAALAAGHSMLYAFQLGTAAGALNVTRHGLATGVRATIEALAERVEVSSVERELAP